MSARSLVIKGIGFTKYTVTFLGMLVFTTATAGEVMAGQWDAAFVSVLVYAPWLWLFYSAAEGMRQFLVVGTQETS